MFLVKKTGSRIPMETDLWVYLRGSFQKVLTTFNHSEHDQYHPMASDLG